MTPASGGGAAGSRLLLPLLVLALAALVAPAVGGCRMDVDVATRVEADGSGEIGLAIEVDEELNALLTEEEPGSAPDLFERLREGLGDRWEVETEAEGAGAGLVASRPYDDPSQFVEAWGAGEGPGLLEDVRLEVEEGLLRDRVRFSATADPLGVMRGVAAERPGDLNPGLVASVVRFEHRLELPGSLGRHNGRVAEDGAVVWSLPLTGATRMSAESTVYDRLVVATLAVAALILLLASGAVLARWWRGRT